MSQIEIREKDENEKNQIHTDKADKVVGPSSQVIEHNGIVYVSGINAIDPRTGILSGTVEEQAEMILTIMEEVLEAMGSCT
ncbi:MAG TPA: hypothetical protein DIU45_09725 [Clostridium sp.]|nr:hypothetical protein [Clostridium sp.]